MWKMQNTHLFAIVASMKAQIILVNCRRGTCLQAPMIILTDHLQLLHLVYFKATPAHFVEYK